MESSSLNPYDVVEEGELMYSFTTVHGIEYRVYFLDYSAYLPGFGGVYSFNIEPENEIPHPIDSRIAQTVVHILRQFFSNHENSMIMVCDNSDGKELKREKLFSRWFTFYNDGTIRKFDASSGNEYYTLYVSLFVHEHNPHIRDLVAAFYELVKRNMYPLDS